MSSHRVVGGPPTSGLLTELLQQNLDPAYADAVQRRRGGEAAPRWGPSAAMVAVVALGLLFAVAYVDTRTSAPSSERIRTALVADVEQETATSEALQQRLETLRADVATAVDDALVSTEDGRAQAAQVQRLEVATGVRAVTGPGVTVTVSDAAPVDSVDPVTGDPVLAVPEAGRVLDIDLQAVVNALWAVGAEAIAVDGQRLSPTSSIRTAGEAILVDFRPVTSPYAVQAVGGGLLPRFADTQVAARYDAYNQLYGIGFDFVAAESLELPAAADIDLRYAGPVEATPPGEND